MLKKKQSKKIKQQAELLNKYGDEPQRTGF